MNRKKSSFNFSYAGPTRLELIPRFLARLEGVKAVHDSQWTAKCPAHEDSNSSLSVGITDDRILVHCFAGCHVQTVVGAMGMNMTDLHLHRFAIAEMKDWAEKAKAKQSLLTLQHELFVLLQCVQARIDGEVLNYPEKKRERKAIAKICKLMEVSHG